MAGARGTGRDAIFAAATELFAERGYARTSVREIGRRAGLDPALVIRYFGSKEQLYSACVRPELDGVLPLAGPIDELGAAMVRAILEPGSPLRATYLGLVRGSDADGIGSMLHELHEEGFVRPLRERLTGEDAELRARLVAALIGGLMYALWIAEDAVLRATDPEEVVARYGAQVQALLVPRG